MTRRRLQVMRIILKDNGVGTEAPSPTPPPVTAAPDVWLAAQVYSTGGYCPTRVLAGWRLPTRCLHSSA